ncbi:MAG TPA: hypothetical protein VNA17_04375 [Pyrinomonadaceae bacterium]|nr:hypothetical protein [Pyrinomonadaceae bacterium]
MKPFRNAGTLVRRHFKFAVAGSIFLLCSPGGILWLYTRQAEPRGPLRFVSTIAGTNGEFGEPFGIAVREDNIYVSDGEHGRIWLIRAGTATVFASNGLETPSGISLHPDGRLIVADSGSHTIKSVDQNGVVGSVAGVEGRRGNVDGDAASALFNAPIGVAVTGDGRIAVADTYNDRIRIIDKGQVITLAGAQKGFADGAAGHARFDTPSGITAWHEKLLVADTANRRLRVVESDGSVWTLAGSGEADLLDGLLAASAFVAPTALAIDVKGEIFVADGSAVRQIGGVIPAIVTISGDRRGIQDGPSIRSRFNRASGLAMDKAGRLLVADSENRLVRQFDFEDGGPSISGEQIDLIRGTAETFRAIQPGRWPFDPPQTPRDIAGTLGEIRGEMTSVDSQVRFHNGLDIAGAYGETARFIRGEKVLMPVATENFGTLRELVRMPTLGYIHIRLGRDQSSTPFGDERFQFERDETGKMVGVRVPRGSKFHAGEPIGTLNAMNHVHLVAGRSGSEVNALAALELPGISDSLPPVIEKITIFDQHWGPVETLSNKARIKLQGKHRVVVRAYDQMDGNSERRRLGVYKLGYQVIPRDGQVTQVPEASIVFDRMPPSDATNLVYAIGSRSGPTGVTVFNYTVTNSCNGDRVEEGFLDTAQMAHGSYSLNISVEDYFGNRATRTIDFEVEK